MACVHRAVEGVTCGAARWCAKRWCHGRVRWRPACGGAQVVNNLEELSSCWQWVADNICKKGAQRHAGMLACMHAYAAAPC